MIKLKVREIWLIDSSFSWEFCLVLIVEKDRNLFRGFILDVVERNELDTEEDLDSNRLWNFCEPPDKFIRRIE